MKALFLVLLLISSCGGQSTHEDLRTGPTPESEQQQEIDQLQQTILQLQGTVNQINQFTSSPFTTCSAALPPFQQTICQIAQTAVAENDTQFFDSLASVVNAFQTQLYGSGCANATDSGCPGAGSIMANLASVQASVASNTASISTINGQITSLQGSVTTLQNSLNSITTRLNNFNGSGQSIETVVTGINSSISTLNSEVAAIQQSLSASSIWKVIQVCSDISNSGPLFEAILESGDKTQVDAYITSGSLYGLGVLEQAGVTGTQYLATTLNTHVCQFKIYDLNSSLKICWDHTNRSQTSAGIDTACDSAHNFANPASACTCK